MVGKPEEENRVVPCFLDRSVRMREEPDLTIGVVDDEVCDRVQSALILRLRKLRVHETVHVHLHTRACLGRCSEMVRQEIERVHNCAQITENADFLELFDGNE